MKDGNLIGLFDANPSGAQEFITYDRYDVVASVYNSDLIIDVLEPMASLHIQVPAERDGVFELDIEAEMINDNEGKFCGGCAIWM